EFVLDVDEKNLLAVRRTDDRPLPRSPVCLKDLHPPFIEEVFESIYVAPRHCHPRAHERVNQVGRWWHTRLVVQARERAVPREEPPVMLDADPSFFVFSRLIGGLRRLPDAPCELRRVAQRSVDVAKELRGVLGIIESQRLRRAERIWDVPGVQSTGNDR